MKLPTIRPRRTIIVTWESQRADRRAPLIQRMVRARMFEQVRMFARSIGIDLDVSL